LSSSDLLRRVIRDSFQSLRDNFLTLWIHAKPPRANILFEHEGCNAEIDSTTRSRNADHFNDGCFLKLALPIPPFSSRFEIELLRASDFSRATLSTDSGQFRADFRLSSATLATAKSGDRFALLGVGFFIGLRIRIRRERGHGVGGAEYAGASGFTSGFLDDDPCFRLRAVAQDLALDVNLVCDE
jgi:hypothetical protein